MLSKQFLGMSREFVFDPLYNNKDILLIRKQVILMQFIISHHRICVLAGSLYYSLLANTIYITGKSMVLQPLKMGVSLLGR